MKEDHPKPTDTKFICQGCGRKVTFDDVKETPTRRKYCDDCHKIDEANRDPSVTLFCIVCEDPFHPNKNYKRVGKLPKYCSPEHRNQDAKSWLSPEFINSTGGSKRLSNKEVKEIRAVYREAKEQKIRPLGAVRIDLSQKYGVSEPIIQHIVYGIGSYKTA